MLNLELGVKLTDYACFLLFTLFGTLQGFRGVKVQAFKDCLVNDILDPFQGEGRALQILGGPDLLCGLQSHARTDGSLILACKFVYSCSVLLEIKLCAHQKEGSPWTMVHDLWNHFFTNSLEGLWNHCGKADKENISVRVTEWA